MSESFRIFGIRKHNNDIYKREDRKRDGTKEDEGGTQPDTYHYGRGEDGTEALREDNGQLFAFRHKRHNKCRLDGGYRLSPQRVGRPHHR